MVETPKQQIELNKVRLVNQRLPLVLMFFLEILKKIIKEKRKKSKKIILKMTSKYTNKKILA